MKLALVAALALTACATETEFDGEVLPGRTLAKELCPTGCTDEVTAGINRSRWRQLDETMYELVDEVTQTIPTGTTRTHGVLVGPDAGQNGSHRLADHVTSDLERGIHPCEGIQSSGTCSNVCTSTVTQGTGAGGCYVVQCPTEVVIARCTP